MPSNGREIGRRDHRIAIQQAAKTQNARGEVALTWPGTTVATLWAERRETAGGEGVTADQLVATRTVTYIIGYRPGILGEMRVVEGSRVFDLQVPLDPDGRKEVLELLCTEVGV